MIPIHLLHAYQLENYQITRFLHFAYTHLLFRIKGSQRQKLDRTKKAILLFLVANGLFIGIQIFSFLFWGISWQFFTILGGSLIVSPFFFVLASGLIFPFERLMKWQLIYRAKKRVKACSKTKIIGITGSYGKTSVKEFLTALLKDSFEVISPIGTHNTLLGISKFILQNLKPSTEIMIVEMGAYVPGDIQALCEITPPYLAILTGITLQHLERFGSLENIIKTKFEITQNLQEGDTLFLDGENENIQTGISLFCQDVPYEIQEIKNLPVRYFPDFQGISFQFQGAEYHTRLLGKHSAKNLSLALAVALKLGIDPSELQKRVEQLPFVNHRLELLYNEHTGVYVLDDSFNGNIEGVKTTVDLLKNTPFQGKRIYLTPGLVELGEKSEEIHFQMGKFLADAVDLVLLIKNPGTLKIQEGLLSKGFEISKITMFETSTEAHQKVGTFAQKGDLIIFQNDLTDNYF